MNEYERVKEEIAREIFEKIEKMQDTYVYETCIYGTEWQSLKSEYLPTEEK